MNWPSPMSGVGTSNGEGSSRSRLPSMRLTTPLLMSGASKTRGSLCLWWTRAVDAPEYLLGMPLCAGRNDDSTRGELRRHQVRRQKPLRANLQKTDADHRWGSDQLYR